MPCRRSIRKGSYARVSSRKGKKRFTITKGKVTATHSYKFKKKPQKEVRIKGKWYSSEIYNLSKTSKPKRKVSF